MSKAYISLHTHINKKKVSLKARNDSSALGTGYLKVWHTQLEHLYLFIYYSSGKTESPS